MITVIHHKNSDCCDGCKSNPYQIEIKSSKANESVFVSKEFIEDLGLSEVLVQTKGMVHGSIIDWHQTLRAIIQVQITHEKQCST